MFLRFKWWLYRKMGWGSLLLYRKRHVFPGPDGMGYRATRHIYRFDMGRRDDLEPFGGAPEIEEPHLAPQWLKDQTD